MAILEPSMTFGLEIPVRSMPVVIAMVVAASACLVAPLSAQAATQRSFVASTGLDTNPCSVSAPCRTFAAAQAQTNSGGEIIVKDSAGYGPITITQSISIIAPEGIYAGISVMSGSGVTIATAGVDVTLKGLTINGQGGTDGILMTAGNSLTVLNASINNFPSTANYGIDIETAANVTIAHSTLTNNNIAILFNSGAQGSISNVVVNRSGTLAIYAIVATTQTQDTIVQVSDTVIDGDRQAGSGIYAQSSHPTYFAQVQATRVNVHNSYYGFGAGSAHGRIAMSNCVSTHNAVGALGQYGGTVNTLGDNVVENNMTDTSFVTGSLSTSSRF